MSDIRPETDAERLDRLDKKLAELRAKEDGKAEAPRADDKLSQANLAWRMVVELVSGLGIGFAIGYGLDWVFGTRPWLMVVFILLGFVAGVKTMMRTAREVAQDAESGQLAEISAEDEEE